MSVSQFQLNVIFEIQLSKETCKIIDVKQMLSVDIFNPFSTSDLGLNVHEKVSSIIKSEH